MRTRTLNQLTKSIDLTTKQPKPTKYLLTFHPYGIPICMKNSNGELFEPFRGLDDDGDDGGSLPLPSLYVYTENLI